MRLFTIVALVVVPVSLAALACEAPIGQERESRGTRASSVINGTASGAEDDAVVLLRIGQGGICTGTLIAPNLVLTARHCVAGPGAGQSECDPLGADLSPASIGVGVGAQPSANVARGTRLFVQPTSSICGQDIALILLDKDVPGVQPRPVRLTPPVVGEQTTAVGYGQDENEQLTGRKVRQNIPVVAVGPATRAVTANGSTVTLNVPANDFATGESVCHGDSGGPLFDAKGLILGTTSRGTPLGCVSAPAIFSSNAAHAPLIKTALAAAGHPLRESAGDAGTDASTDGGVTRPPAGDAGADASPPTTTDAGTSTGPGSTTEGTEGASEEIGDDDDDETTEEDEDDDARPSGKGSKSKSKASSRATGGADMPAAAACAASGPTGPTSLPLVPVTLSLALALSLVRRRRGARRAAGTERELERSLRSREP